MFLVHYQENIQLVAPVALKAHILKMIPWKGPRRHMPAIVGMLRQEDPELRTAELPIYRVKGALGLQNETISHFSPQVMANLTRSQYNRGVRSVYLYFCLNCCNSSSTLSSVYTVYTHASYSLADITTLSLPYFQSYI